MDAAAGDGSTPLILAALGGHLEAAAVLVAAGASVNVKNKAGWTPLIAAAAAGQVRAAWPYKPFLEYQL